MTKWSAAEFDRYAIGTKITERTLDACRDVLVNQVPGVEAARTWKLFPAQISRAIATLEAKKEEMVNSAKELQEDSALLKFTATKVAEQIFGSSLNVKDAVAGKSYEGPTIVCTHGFAVQRVGRGAVLHDLGMLDQVPTPAVSINIAYPVDGQKAKVTKVEATPKKDLAR